MGSHREDCRQWLAARSRQTSYLCPVTCALVPRMQTIIGHGSLVHDEDTETQTFTKGTTCIELLDTSCTEDLASGGVGKYQCSFRKRTDPLSLSSFSTLCTKTSVKYLPKPLCRIVKTTKNLHLEFYLLYSIAPPIYSMPHIYVPFTLSLVLAPSVLVLPGVRSSSCSLVKPTIIVLILETTTSRPGVQLWMM